MKHTKQLKNFAKNIFLHLFLYLFTCFIGTLLLTIAHHILALYLSNDYIYDPLYIIFMILIHYIFGLLLCSPFYLVSILCIIFLRRLNNYIFCAAGGIITSIPSVMYITPHNYMMIIRWTTPIIIGSIIGLLYCHLYRSAVDHD